MRPAKHSSLIWMPAKENTRRCAAQLPQRSGEGARSGAGRAERGRLDLYEPEPATAKRRRPAGPRCSGAGHQQALSPPGPVVHGDADSVHVAQELVVDPPALGVRRDRQAAAMSTRHGSPRSTKPSARDTRVPPRITQLSSWASCARRDFAPRRRRRCQSSDPSIPTRHGQYSAA